MNFPPELRYTKTHEWARKEGGRITAGITDYAQKEISDVVFVELPKAGQNANQGKALAVVESVKAAFDIYMPVSGKITKVNTELEENPGLANQDSYGKGWFFEIEMAQPAEWDSLLTARAYEEHIKQEAGKH